MRATNILAIIFGVLIVIGGIYCLMMPAATYMSLAWLIGVVMIVDGIANIVTWFQLRKSGFSNGWALFGAIVSIIFGIVLLGSFVAQFAVDLFFAYMIAAWLIVTGIMRIGYSVQMRKLNRGLQPQSIGDRWWFVLIVGVLVVIVGVMCLFNPMIAMVGMGLLIGISVIVVGVSVITLAL